MSGDYGFRSEKMELVQIVMQSEVAHDTVDELCSLSCVQFRDSEDNKDRTAFQRQYAHEVRLCDEILRKIRFVRDAADKAGLILEPTGSTVEGLGETPVNLVELNVELDDVEKELKGMIGRQRVMDEGFQELEQHRHLLRNLPKLGLNRRDTLPSTPLPAMGDGEELEEGAGGGDTTALRTIAGLLDVDKKAAFQLVVWRVSRGNALIRFADSPRAFADPAGGGATAERDCFAVYFSGSVLQDKLGRLLTTLGAARFALPGSDLLLNKQLSDVSRQVEDHSQVRAESVRQQRQLLTRYMADVELWEVLVTREKAVHDAMNLFNSRISPKTTLAEAWVPKAKISAVEAALRRGAVRGGGETPSVLSMIHTRDTPPTYIKLNKLTSTFQGLNDAYGVPRYQELNPGIFYVVTYSFLFGVMFGDIGHGTLMLCGALFLVVNEGRFAKRKLNELIAPAYHGRYVLLLMSVFSIYCGAVYNECFGIALLPWSYYQVDCPKNQTGCNVAPLAPPPFGVDPLWSISENKLGFANSFKMKISIIIGVSQMAFGLACKTANCFYFKQWKELYYENIPEFLFLFSIFGYLCVLIILKWTTNWVGLGLPAPALLDTLLKMVLEVGAPIAKEDLLYTGQATVQPLLVALAFICVPWMLLPKPLLLKAEHERGYHAVAMGDEEHRGGGGHDEHGEEFDFQEIMIHQMIHTIEFVLGAISNTASYLRLWALSLAHAGLSEVFWERVVLNSLEVKAQPYVHGLIIFCAFAVWACMTFGVLMVMETLSACLHDIRLHWVEFQNKFYKGDGTLFTPFSYETIGAREDE